MSGESPRSPRRRGSHGQRDTTPSRRRRPSDLESTHRRHQSTDRDWYGSPASPSKTHGYVRQVASPGPYGSGNQDPMSAAPLTSGSASPDLRRKVSLIRPERRKNDDSDPQYYYRKHAQKMTVIPSTTGNDPMLEDFDDHNDPTEELETPQKSAPLDRGLDRAVSNKLQRKSTRRNTMVLQAEKEQRKREKQAADARAPSLWRAYCQLITFWCPNFVLSMMGKKKRPEQSAWREKMGLISIIMLVACFVAFLTFGFTDAVCPDGGPQRLQNNKVGNGYMIFHGSAYDLTKSKHPAARGIAAGANVLWDLAEKEGGMDGSFLFQSVNGACKDIITLANGSDVVTNSEGDLAWYFPCNTFKQDGSSKPNFTDPYYLGYACHTAKTARLDFYDLKKESDVYFTWEGVKNESRNLIVYNGDVLDLNLLEWFNKTQVSYPSRFDQIREDSSIRGLDMTMALSSSDDKKTAECFQQIIKVGSIDTETVGCIASKVVLYVSLAFVLSIVISKFLIALVFQWFLCRKYAADRSSYGKDKKKRNDQIEDWSDDIYRPAPKLVDPASTASDKSTAKRSSFLPTTSRFTSPYAMENSRSKSRPAPTTMASQSSTARLIPGQSDRSESNFPYSDSDQNRADSRISLMPNDKRFSSVAGADAPSGFISESVVAQPPPEWQPFGYPLAHTICLVTAYSEGPEGIRSTLDSIATTEYPNSHKLILMICDGLIKGRGETMSTPEVCLSMMKDHTILPDEVQPFSYVAVASGSKRHNMAKVYSGFYDYGEDSRIAAEKQQRVPMLVIVKCGTPAEAEKSKPGNRGKRDSQIILMGFLQKVMFDERMTELEYEMFNGIYKITGISPDFYEIVMMVDADTKVFPDCLTHMVSAMVKDPEIMGLCGETKIANKRQSWTTMIQVFEYFISHHLAKSFESAFGGVTCLPGCFSMYRIKTPKGGQNYWVPILANPDIVEHYSENVVDTLHKKNLLLLGEDRYLSTLMLRTFPKRKQVFVPQAVCKTTVPETFAILLSQRRRWINSTVHNLMELVLVRDLCGTFCFSMQFVVLMELVATVVLPFAIAFTVYLIIKAIVAAIMHTTIPIIPLVLLSLILGLPGVLVVLTAHRFSYVAWMFIYLLSLPIWNGVLPMYSFWKFDDFSWGDTRQTDGVQEKGGHGDVEGEFDSSQITMKRWVDFEHDRRMGGTNQTWTKTPTSFTASPDMASQQLPRPAHQRTGSNLGYESNYDY